MALTRRDARGSVRKAKQVYCGKEADKLLRKYRVGIYVDNGVTLDGLNRIIDAVNYRLRVFAPEVSFSPEGFSCSRQGNFLCWTVEYNADQWVAQGTLIYQALLQVERYDLDLDELRRHVRQFVVHLYYCDGDEPWRECA